MKKHFIFFLLLSFLLGTTPSFAIRIYVKANATGNNTGTTWADAYNDLQVAISNAVSGDEIWVAAGTYKPTATTTRTISFAMKSGVKMYGGFNGTESLLSERDFSVNTTTLNGDIGQIGVDTDNSYHVVSCPTGNIQTRLDGFRIINGHADGNNNYGGGLYLSGSTSPVIANCNFLNNYAEGEGSAVYINSTSTNAIDINNSLFSYNNAAGILLGGNAGGTIAMSNGKVNLTKCVISFNSTSTGGAMNLANGECRINRCVIAGNTASNSAGVIYANAIDLIHIYNTLIVGNEAGSNAVFYFDQIASSNIVNCTIAHNRKNNGGSTSAMTFGNTFGNPSLSAFKNNIVWDNSTPQMTAGYGSIVSNSIIQGGYTGGTSILTTNPNFLAPGTLASAPFDTMSLNYRVNYFAPPVNAGSNAYISTSYPADLDGITRPFGATVDMGAFELSYCLATPTILASGPTTFCSGEPLTLSVGASTQSQTWSTGSTASSIVVTNSGNYSVTAIDTAGCIGTASQQVTAIIPNISITGSSILCVNDTVVLTANGGVHYLWSNGDTTNTTQITTGGNFWVYGINASGCSDTVYKTITVKPLPTPTISFQESSGLMNDDAIICAGSSIMFMATGGSSYSWNTGSTSSNVAFLPTSDYSYFVKVTNPSGCSAYSDTINVTVLPTPLVTFTFMDSVPFYAAPITLGNGTPSGGVYNGIGISNNILDPQIAGLGAQSVSYTYTDANACSTTITETYYITMLVGIESSTSPKISIYPNPASQFLQITGMPQHSYTYKISNLEGKIYAGGTFEGSNTLTISTLPSGVYFIQIDSFIWKWVKE